MLWLLLGVWQKKSEKTGDAAGFAKKRQNEAIKTTTLAKAAVACFWLQAKSFAILLANPSPFRHPVHSASSSCATNQRTSVNDGLPWGFAATRSFHLEPSLLPSAPPPLSLSLRGCADSAPPPSSFVSSLSRRRGKRRKDVHRENLPRLHRKYLPPPALFACAHSQ